MCRYRIESAAEDTDLGIWASHLQQLSCEVRHENMDLLGAYEEFHTRWRHMACSFRKDGLPLVTSTKHQRVGVPHPECFLPNVGKWMQRCLRLL